MDYLMESSLYKFFAELLIVVILLMELLGDSQLPQMFGQHPLSDFRFSRR
jgi:hypothetical protein